MFNFITNNASNKGSDVGFGLAVKTDWRFKSVFFTTEIRFSIITEIYDMM